MVHLKQISPSDGVFVEPVAIDPAPAPVLEIGEAIEALRPTVRSSSSSNGRADGALSSIVASTVITV